jgi:hypothetical protein
MMVCTVLVFPIDIYFFEVHIALPCAPPACVLAQNKSLILFVYGYSYFLLFVFISLIGILLLFAFTHFLLFLVLLFLSSSCS